MALYNTILVPLDGSTLAEAALIHAQVLAESFGSTIVLTRVFELPHLANTYTEPPEEYGALPRLSAEQLQHEVQEATAYLERQSHSLRDAGLSCRTRIVFGPVAATIMNTAVEEEADLVAMASHGAGGLTGVYYGSVAAGVLQRIDRPLLIVRANE